MWKSNLLTQTFQIHYPTLTIVLISYNAHLLFVVLFQSSIQCYHYVQTPVNWKSTFSSIWSLVCCETWLGCYFPLYFLVHLRPRTSHCEKTWPNVTWMLLSLVQSFVLLCPTYVCLMSTFKRDCSCIWVFKSYSKVRIWHFIKNKKH